MPNFLAHQRTQRDNRVTITLQITTSSWTRWSTLISLKRWYIKPSLTTPPIRSLDAEPIAGYLRHQQTAQPPWTGRLLQSAVKSIMSSRTHKPLWSGHRPFRGDNDRRLNSAWSQRVFISPPWGREWSSCESPPMGRKQLSIYGRKSYMNMNNDRLGTGLLHIIYLI